MLPTFVSSCSQPTPRAIAIATPFVYYNMELKRPLPSLGASYLLASTAKLDSDSHHTTRTDTRQTTPAHRERASSEAIRNEPAFEDSADFDPSLCDPIYMRDSRQPNVGLPDLQET